VKQTIKHVVVDITIILGNVYTYAAENQIKSITNRKHFFLLLISGGIDDMYCRELEYSTTTKHRVIEFLSPGRNLVTYTCPPPVIIIGSS
jgi:hypothetical protein